MPLGSQSKRAGESGKMPDLDQAQSGKQNLAELDIVLLPEEERPQ